MAESGRRQPVGRTRDAEGAQQPDLSPAEPEPFEDRFLSSSEVWSEARQPSRHLELADAEIRSGRVPTDKQTIGDVIGHMSIVNHYLFHTNI